MATLYFPEKYLRRQTDTQGGYSGGGGFLTDILWLMITPRKVEYMSDNARGSSAISSVIASDFPSYAFAMPSDFQLTMDPKWDKFDTLASGANEALSKGLASTKTAGSVGVGPGINGRGAKNDSPMVYEDTQRLAYSFTFTLLAESWNGSSRSDDVRRQVFSPCEAFMKMASPVNTDSGTLAVGFQFPYVFSLSSFYFVNGAPQPVDVIQVDDAACTAVQPKYTGPYIGGYPVKADLTLTFTDLRPVFRDSISQGSKSKVTIKVNGK